MADVYSLLHRWLYLRPSEICDMGGCAAGRLGEHGPPPIKYRKRESIPWSMERWLDIDLCLRKDLTKAEFRQMVLFLTGRNGYRMSQKLSRKLTRVFRRRGLIR